MAGSEIVVVFNGLAAFAGALEGKVQAAINATAVELRDDAKASMTAVYPPASSAGEPPARRTGTLLAGITDKPSTGHLEAQVVSSAPYSTYLEYGTRKMAARPSMTPAAERARPKLAENVAKAVG